MLIASRPVVLYQLGWLRALAATLVVLYHIHEIMLKPTYFGVSVLPIAAAGNSGVQLFFVISGFVIYYAHHADAERSPCILSRFIGKRVRRLYPPLWIILTIVLTAQIAGIITPMPSLKGIIGAYAITPATHEEMLSVEWTLRHEILFYGLFMLFLWRRTIGLPVLVTWAALSVPVAFIDPSFGYLHFFFDPNHVLFLMGMTVAWLHIATHVRWGLLALLAGIAIFAGSYALEVGNEIGHGVSGPIYGLGGALAIYGLVSLPASNINIRWLEHLGASSYALYLVHNPIVSIMAKVSVAADRLLHFPPILYLMAAFAACQIVGLLFHYYVENLAIQGFDRVRARLGTLASRLSVNLSARRAR